MDTARADTGGIGATRPPAPDFETVTAEELAAYSAAENRFRSSAAARAVLGEPDPGATVEWRHLALPGRELPVRVHRPNTAPDTGSAAAQDAGSAVAGSRLPLVVHVHGGGFVGTATQCDWTTSHLAARLPALVVSVEHRLLAPGLPLAEAAADGWEALVALVRDAERWGVDPERVAVLGESCGALISALSAVRAAAEGLPLRAQVLVNPVTDVTAAMFDHPSVAAHGDRPGPTLPLLRLVRRLAVPSGDEAAARALSPLHAPGLGRTAPALVVVPTRDSVADHGRRHAERLRAAGVPVRLTEYPDAPHAFLTLPGLEPQAVAARAEILGFLRTALEAR
ncbi:alpha/beta hydrolase [Kitasatospora phosalacinea]|uniref:Alpha/beta hydrolase n=1 Tax=Kitasatospora phosalacinea TaxID=2065 RepID=A0A9W6UXZ7_9ACTN|nr:alpha/beta hydrolase fold domain-containing protein [Kitasatospora phosalacinea]GLW68176.1 alpha/beta hydrolase [Kitasatospora phosalacinea]